MNTRDRREYNAHYYVMNRERLLAKSAAYSVAHPRAGRRLHLKWRYGLTPEDYDAMVLAQDGKCPICERRVRLVVDHDHDTGMVRGLLCYTCNTALDTIDLDRARAYLQGSLPVVPPAYGAEG
jgi:hypothetical protein